MIVHYVPRRISPADWKLGRFACVALARCRENGHRRRVGSEPEPVRPRLLSWHLSDEARRIFGAILLALVVGMSVGVGFAAHGRGFDWAVASVFGTAVGTRLLAVGTLALAYSTWQDVRASQQIAETTARSLALAEDERDERVRPILIGTIIAITTDPPKETRPFLSAELQNVGGGVAVRIEVWAEYWEGGVATDTALFPALIAGERFPIALNFDANLKPSKRVRVDDFRVRGQYRDRFGRVLPPIIDWQFDSLASPDLT